MKIGIIGAGNIATHHRKGYLSNGAEVVAIADVSGSMLERRKKEWNVDRAYTDYPELLNQKDIDAVSICTPNAYHHPATLAAAKAGKHILCEKPISLSLEQAQEMIDACKKAGVVLQINHHLRSNAAAAKSKHMIDTGELGHINFIRLRQAHDWGGLANVSDNFGKTALAGGGTLLDNGCHMFDLASYFGGAVSEVYARIATLKFDIEVEDISIATLKFVSGTLGDVENSWCATGWEEGFWIYGSQGSLEYTNRYGKPVLRHSFRSSSGTTWDTTDISTFDFTGESNHTRHIANFLAAIRGEREVICSGEDGLKAVQLVLASYESAKQNQPIKVNDFFVSS
jgi:predicted dehydrogenase